MTDAISIRVVERKGDWDAVYRFRYETYVAELGWKQVHADHAARTIHEPLDETGVTVAAFRGEEVVGTVRRNFGSTCDLGIYPALCSMPQRAGNLFPNYVSLTTKMLVAPSYRGTMLPTRMGIEAYRVTWEKGAEIDFITFDVRLTHLARYYGGIGYIESGEPVKHPEFGLSRVMEWRFRDLNYLVSIRSPFADVCRECLANNQHTPQEKLPLSLLDLATSA